MSLTLDRLCALVEQGIASEAGRFTWAEGGYYLDVRRSDGPEADGPDTAFDPGQAGIVTAAMLGQLHLHPEDGAPPFVKPGDLVHAGQRLGLIEAMKSFCPIVSEQAGRLVEVLAEHGAEVAAGQNLFRLV